MPRPKADGTPARAVNRRKLTDLWVQGRKVKVAELVWDIRSPGLALAIRPSGRKAWRVIYRFPGRPRWLTSATSGRSVSPMPAVRRDGSCLTSSKEKTRSPSARRNAAPAASPTRRPIVELYAKRHNKSWKQAQALVRQASVAALGQNEGVRHRPSRCPRMMIRIEAPIVANQTLAAASAIFTWAVAGDLIAIRSFAHGPGEDRTRRSERLVGDDRGLDSHHHGADIGASDRGRLHSAPTRQQMSRHQASRPASSSCCVVLPIARRIVRPDRRSCRSYVPPGARRPDPFPSATSNMILAASCRAPASPIDRTSPSVSQRGRPAKR